MSSTTFLTKPDIRERFSSEFTKPKLQVKKEILAPPLTKRYSLVGTAFDYLLRFHIERLNPQFTIKQGWIAEAALHLLSDEYFEKAEIIIRQAKANLIAVINGIEYLLTWNCTHIRDLKSKLPVGHLVTNHPLSAHHWNLPRNKYVERPHCY
ncbi:MULTISPECIES: hypothetical protein [Methylomicrobium]|uniref:hypothetical protein n=1 Tax=Methylomicrobium TaxID=39773 RepID=UPI0002623E7D|nr:MULTISPECIES: hypothetical protein [Methylomicrobium]